MLDTDGNQFVYVCKCVCTEKSGEIMIETTLPGHLMSNIGGVVTPEAGFALYEHVSVRERHGTRFLVAHGNCVGIFAPQTGAWDPDRGGVFRPVNGPFETLFSLMRLVHPPVQWGALDACVFPEEAVQWCLDHGLPEYDEPVVIPDLDDFGYWFPLEYFQKQTITLFLVFECWRILVSEAWDQFDAVLIALSDTPERIHGLSLEQKKHYAQWNLFSDIIGQRVRRIRPMYTWPLGPDGSPDGAPSIRMVASSLFDYVFFQLAQLTMKPKSEVTQRLKLCRGCSQFFWGHGNRRYCSRQGCDRRTIWSRKERKIKKLMRQDLQQSDRHGAPVGMC
jgi:hypothetical protein